MSAHCCRITAVGQYDGGRLYYAGTVDGGFTKASRAAVLKRLPVSSLQWTACPFVDLPHHAPYRRHHPWDERIFLSRMSTIQWVPPTTVIEATHLGQTRHGLLRDARFLAIREDKVPNSVTKE